MRRLRRPAAGIDKTSLLCLLGCALCKIQPVTYRKIKNLIWADPHGRDFAAWHPIGLTCQRPQLGLQFQRARIEAKDALVVRVQ